MRFGSAEIYNIGKQVENQKLNSSKYLSLVEKLDEIADSLCVGQKINDGQDERVILFLKMARGHVFGDALVRKIRAIIRKELSARHVPAIVLEIEDIPVSS